MAECNYILHLHFSFCPERLIARDTVKPPCNQNLCERVSSCAPQAENEKNGKRILPCRLYVPLEDNNHTSSTSVFEQMDAVGAGDTIVSRLL